MDERRLAYSRAKPLAWRDALMGEAQGILGGLRDGSDREVGDEVDRATREADQALALRTRDRKLVRKIDQARPGSRTAPRVTVRRRASRSVWRGSRGAPSPIGDN